MEYLILVGQIVAFIGVVSVMIKAFMQGDTLWGILIFLFGILAFFYCFKNWEETKVPFFITIGGLALIVAGVVLA